MLNRRTYYGYFLYFMALHFIYSDRIFLPIFISKIRLVPIILIGIAGGAFLELCQLVLNTGSVCLDDIMMYTIGAMLGYGLKLLIEKTRSVLTLGHDANMLKLYYIDKKDEE